jgi:hypothetical protein
MGLLRMSAPVRHVRVPRPYPEDQKGVGRAT